MNFQQSWEKKRVFWRTYKRSRFKGGAKEASYVVAAEEGHHFRLEQHRRLLKSADMLQQMRTEHSDCAEICPVR